MDEGHIKDLFSIDEDEINPFYSSRHDSFTFEGLVELYVQCEDCWEKRLANRYSRGRLEREGFVERNIDLEKKGAITIDDFARFINFEGNTYYRTRDLMLLFRRITGGFELYF